MTTMRGRAAKASTRESDGGTDPCRAEVDQASDMTTTAAVARGNLNKALANDIVVSLSSPRPEPA